MKVTLIGWKRGLEKVSLTKAIQSHSALGLGESKRMTDSLIEGETITVECNSSESAVAFRELAQSLGAICQQQPLSKNDFPKNLVKSIQVLQQAFTITSYYGENKDRFGMVFCGNLAYLLHNLPSHLSHPETYDEDLFWDHALWLHDRLLIPYANDLAVTLQAGERPRDTEAVVTLAPKSVIDSYLDLVYASFLQQRARWNTEDGSLIFKSANNSEIDDMGHTIGPHRNTWLALNGPESQYWGNATRVLADISQLMLNWSEDVARRLPGCPLDKDSPFTSESTRQTWENFLETIKTAIL